MKFFDNYHIVLQHDITDCGAACLAMVCRHYGLKYPIARIREEAGTDQKGTNVFGLVKTAEKLGFTAKGVRAVEEALYEQFPLPAIAHVIIDNQLLHYIVIYKITKNEIIAADPAKGLVKYTLEEFKGIWSGVLILMVPTPQFQTGDQTKGLFGRFVTLLFPHKRLLIGILLASILFTILGIIGAFYFKFVIDDILPYNLSKTLHVVSVAFIVLAIFKVFLNGFRSYMLLVLSQKLDISLILGYYHHVLKLPMNFFGTRKAGEIISRLLDTSKVRDAISGAALSIVADSLMVIVGGAILFAQNHYLFGVTIIVVPLYGLVVWGFHKSFERLNRLQMEKNAQLTSFVFESIKGIETIKSYNAEEKATAKTEKYFISLLKVYFRYGFLQNLQGSIKMFLQVVGGIVILWCGSYQVINGRMSMGQLITFNALLAYFLDPIQNLINMQSNIQTAIVAADRLGEILDLEQERMSSEDKKLVKDKLKGSIYFDHVNFRYGNRELILKGIQLKIQPGEKIALVGGSGSGKTTIAKLLLRFYSSEEGEIYLDNNNIKDINIDWLRRRISYVSQDNFFFSGSIVDNLTLGVDDQINYEKIIEAAKMSEAHDFINSFPLRYETLLEENASNLSGGQKQRLALARALLKEPDILILDEATSNLDTVTEKAVSETINGLEGITTIVIAHRLSTIKRCDKIYVMEKGVIVESGTHNELMSQKGAYFDLWKDQLPEWSEKEIPYRTSVM